MRRVRSRVRLYFCSRRDRGTIFGSEELFGILSPKKMVHFDHFSDPQGGEIVFFSPPWAFTRESSLILHVHSVTHKIGHF